jgi:hypothetical protein
MQRTMGDATAGSGAATEDPHDAWTAFGVGVLGGVIGGLSLLTFAGILAVALIAISGGLAVRPRPFGAAGVLVGWAVAWVLALGAAQARCDPGSCVGPDLTPWLTTAAILGVIGVVLLIVGIARPSWAPPLASAGARLASRRPIRLLWAVGIGYVAGWSASSLLFAGWATTIPLAIWFVWNHRGRGRRIEIAWFALAAIATFIVLVPR